MENATRTLLCPHCGQRHQADAKFCTNTGRALPTEPTGQTRLPRKSGTLRRCPHCGKQHAFTARVCPETGRSLLGTEGPAPATSPLFFAAGIVLIVLALVYLASQLLDNHHPGETTPSLTPSEMPVIATTTVPQPPVSSSASSTASAGSNPSARTRVADNMTMMLVPEGNFIMGSRDGIGDDDEHPQHTVFLTAFWMDKTEVTNAMYSQCVHAGACTPPHVTKSSTRGTYYGDPQYDDYPAVNVDWNQASSYCDWAGAQLPTEAEWEKAARGTDGRTYPWGEGIDCSFANYYGCGLNDTVDVASLVKGSSPYAIYGLAGNVSEWVADWYDPNYYVVSPASNPSGPSSGQGRVLRGGSWNHFPDKVSVSTRLANQPDVWDYAIGFRCAAAAP